MILLESLNKMPDVLHLSDDEAGVVAAEAERVAHRDIDIRLTGF